MKAEIDRKLEWLDEHMEQLYATQYMTERAAGGIAFGYGRAVYQAMRDYLEHYGDMIEEVTGNCLSEHDAAE